jgi:adenylosuccinate synthase
MIVLGMGFGDEGKGLTTSLLCAKCSDPIVVRFNGGHQAGHTVVKDGKAHVFSNFGSGTLQGVPSVWSHYCTFYPTSFYNELKHLKDPKIYIHALCPVTTPYDIAFNRTDKISIKDGTCGVGFGATLKRHESFYKLYAQDLFYEDVLVQKLKNIASYYNLPDIELGEFLQAVSLIRNKIELITSYQILNKKEVIFEGAQGILLDQDFGFFPNVTRSNTSSKNALSIWPSKEVYYVTRSYQTRHGNGFMTNEGKELILSKTENETNISNPHQGKFRRSILDVDLLNYSLKCDSNFSWDLDKNLVITCVDQTGEIVKITKNGVLLSINIYDLPKALDCKFKNVYISKGPEKENIIKIQ